MPSRTRTRNGQVQPFAPYIDYKIMKGTGVKTVHATQGTQNATTRYEWISDWYETDPPPYPDHNLSIVKRNCEPIAVEGSTRVFENATYTIEREWRGATLVNGCHYNDTPSTKSIDFAYWMTKALANINPNKADIDLPVAIAELKDLPKMVKNLGDAYNFVKNGGKTPTGLAKVLAESNLNWNFGWAPLISDVSDLFGFADLVNKRTEYLRRLREGTRIRRNLGKLDYQPLTQVNNVQSGGYVGYSMGQWPLRFDATTKGRTSVWFTCKSVLTTPLPDERSLDQAAKNAVLGLNLSPSTAWNLLPWSWLSDWFTNSGDYISLFGNKLKYQVRDLNVMARTEQVKTWSPTIAFPGTKISSSGKAVTIQKQRQVYPYPTPRLTIKPWINPTQAGILGSLFTLHTLKGLKL